MNGSTFFLCTPYFFASLRLSLCARARNILKTNLDVTFFLRSGRVAPAAVRQVGKSVTISNRSQNQINEGLRPVQRMPLTPGLIANHIATLTKGPPLSLSDNRGLHKTTCVSIICCRSSHIVYLHSLAPWRITWCTTCWGSSSRLSSAFRCLGQLLR